MASDYTNTIAANARAFNNWLVNEWLAGYPYKNVAVFDFYNVLTSNGGDADTNDAGWEAGNHHRWWHGAIQHIQTVDYNMAAYPSGDDHPSQAGNQKATSEFLNLLNVAYNNWKGEGPTPPPPGTETVSTPGTPGGPASGARSTEYLYSTGGSVSSLGDPVQYFFNWGDGTNSGWLNVGVNSASKSWDSAGTYNVTVQARCATHTSVFSSWSPVLRVTITGNDGPDLTGEWTYLNATCKDTKSGTKCKVQGTFNVRNIGNQDASSTSVNFYLSGDGEQWDTFLRSVPTGKIRVEGSRSKKLSYSFQTGEDVRGKYIIAVIDEGGYLEELDESNNVIVSGQM